jgi:hypothetical protein
MMSIDVLADRESKTGWLKYVLDTFALVSRANFGFNLCGPSEHSGNDSGTVITYGIENSPDGARVIAIPRVNDYQPGDFNYIAADASRDARLGGTLIPVFRKTFSPGYSCPGKPLLQSRPDGPCCAAQDNSSIKLSFDLFYNCFIHLSCLEEWQHGERSDSIHSFDSKLKGREAIYQKPVVNYLFAILEDMLLLLAEGPDKGLLFPGREGFRICLTHDVDYVRKTASLRAKRSAFHLSNACKDLGKAKVPEALKEARKSLNFLLKPGDYWQFDYVQKLEEARNFRSTFYFYAGEKDGSFKKAFLDPGYDAARNTRLKGKIRELAEKGWEAGLHGSFDSYNSPEIFSREKERLEAIAGSPVLSTRQHWLNLSLKDTWRIQAEAGIKADTTLGSNHFIGFRGGLATPFYPYDHDNEARHQVLEVPMVLMDGTLFDHCRMDDGEARARSFEILEEVRKFNGCAAVNWHQRTPSSDYNWYWLYQEILDWIKVNKGEGIPISRCVEALDGDEALLPRAG